MQRQRPAVKAGRIVFCHGAGWARQATWGTAELCPWPHVALRGG